MNKYDVQIALEGLYDARTRWIQARRVFEKNAMLVLHRLLHEAAANFMSAEEVAQASGYTARQIRAEMRKAGMDTRKGKVFLAKHAAEALASNSELLGMAPHQMDLMSPLAYLPMGQELRQEITDKTTSKVTEIADPEVAVYEVAYLLWQFNQGYILAEDRAVGENWMLDHYRNGTALHEDDARELPGWLDAARQVIALVSGNSQ